MSKILVVDDFEDSRFSLSRLLEMSGYEVVEAASGLEAVEAARTHLPDLILMDLSLPEIDGIEATRRIRAMEGLPRMTIVAASAHDGPTFISRATEAGCDHYITKPIDFDNLERMLADLLKA